MNAGDDDIAVLSDGREVPMRRFIDARGCNFMGVIRVIHKHYVDLSPVGRFRELPSRPMTEAQRDCVRGQ